MTTHHIAFWNVENLFDVRTSPRRSDKLQRTIGKELKGWTQAVLDTKLRQLAKVITWMNGGQGPDILGVCEVENAHVLQLLVDRLAGLGRDYGIAHHDGEDGRGIDVAFIYDKDRFQAEETFSHYIVKRTATRDLFQVNFRTKPGGNLLVLVGNHWPSRMGGQLESEPYRIIAGETLAYFHEGIRRALDSKDVAVMAMGDFNDEPSDRSLTGYALAERERGRVTRARSPKFLNLMWPLMGTGQATHYYGSEGSMLDQIMVSKGLLKKGLPLRVKTDSAAVLRHDEHAPKGVPVRYGRGSTRNEKGFSDHFPVCVEVEER